MIRIRRQAGALVVAVAGALALAGGAAAKICDTVSGDFTSVLLPPAECAAATGVCTRGTLTGDFPSTYEFGIETLVPDPSVPGRLLYSGTSVITRERGRA